MSDCNNTVVADVFTSLQDQKQPLIETPQQNVSSIPTDPVILGDGASNILEEVLATAYEQLGALELKTEEVAWNKPKGMLCSYWTLGAQLRES